MMVSWRTADKKNTWPFGVPVLPAWHPPIWTLHQYKAWVRPDDDQLLTVRVYQTATTMCSAAIEESILYHSDNKSPPCPRF